MEAIENENACNPIVRSVARSYITVVKKYKFIQRCNDVYDQLYIYNTYNCVCLLLCDLIIPMYTCTGLIPFN